MKLFAPEGYWKLTPEEKEKIVNGAGPKGYGWLVPDTIWGLSITEAANIHDFCYAVGTTIDDKIEADRIFMNNMVRLISAGKWWLKGLRMRRARKYYLAVKHFGGPAFWSGKNKPEEME